MRAGMTLKKKGKHIGSKASINFESLSIYSKNQINFRFYPRFSNPGQSSSSLAKAKKERKHLRKQ